jgi:hypothetical protein
MISYVVMNAISRATNHGRKRQGHVNREKLSLNAKGHAEKIGRRTDGNKPSIEGLPYNWTHGQGFNRRSGCRVAPQVLYAPRRRGYALRSLPEAATIRIVASWRR